MPTLNISESFAHLIQGYHRMLASGSEGVSRGTIQHNNQYNSTNNLYNPMALNKAATIWRYESEKATSPSSQIMPTNNVMPVLPTQIVKQKELKTENLTKRCFKSPTNLIFLNNERDLIPPNNNIAIPICRSAPPTPKLLSRSIPIFNKTKDAEFAEGDYAYPMSKFLN